MAKQMSFEERLQKLSAKDGQSSQMSASAPNSEAVEGSARRMTPDKLPGSRRGGFGKAALGILLAGFLGMLGIAFHTVQQTGGLAAYTTAETTAEVEQKPNTSKDPGFFAKLIGGPLAPDGFTEFDSKPGAYLPNPGDGWMRITQDDAADPAIADKIRSNWPTGIDALRQHSGYKTLNQFLKSYKVHDMETRVLSKKRSRAIYLHPNGEWVWVRVEFLDNVRALGTKDAPQTWMTGLEDFVEKEAQKTEVLETVTLGDITGINRVPEKRTMQAVPINERRNARNFIRFSVPLSHRVVVSFQGYVTPAKVNAFLDSMPKTDFLALLD